MKCATHPDVETNLRCGKCGKPICPRCMVETPVGARCRECARLRRPPQYELSAGQLARAAGAGLAVAVAVGVAWSILWRLVPFFYLSIVIALGAGYAVAELVSRSVNRKRGPVLQGIAAAGVVIAYVIARFDVLNGVFRLSLVGLLDFWSMVALAAALFMAVTRIR